MWRRLPFDASLGVPKQSSLHLIITFDAFKWSKPLSFLLILLGLDLGIGGNISRSRDKLRSRILLTFSRSTTVSQFLQHLMPLKQENLERSIANMWLHRAVSEPGLFNALMFGQFTRDRVSKGPLCKQDSPELISCHSEAVREINKKFQNTSSACDDENILAVAILSYNGNVIMESPPASPRQGPLQALQVLNIYGGAVETVSVHADGLAKMISIRGGLQNIKLAGLAARLS